jgi:hypothetical protein
MTAFAWVLEVRGGAVSRTELLSWRRGQRIGHRFRNFESLQ